jgi:hypothetical protein
LKVESEEGEGEGSSDDEDSGPVVEYRWYDWLVMERTLYSYLPVYVCASWCSYIVPSIVQYMYVCGVCPKHQYNNSKEWMFPIHTHTRTLRFVENNWQICA